MRLNGILVFAKWRKKESRWGKVRAHLSNPPWPDRTVKNVLFSTFSFKTFCFSWQCEMGLKWNKKCLHYSPTLYYRFSLLQAWHSADVCLCWAWKGLLRLTDVKIFIVVAGRWEIGCLLHFSCFTDPLMSFSVGSLRLHKDIWSTSNAVTEIELFGEVGFWHDIKNL